VRIDALIEHLEAVRADAGDVDVRVAYQPSYPLRGSVEAIGLDVELGGDERVVWIAVGSAPYAESPYAPADAWEGGR
jgi:hypothetical protein